MVLVGESRFAQLFRGHKMLFRAFQFVPFKEDFTDARVKIRGR